MSLVEYNKELNNIVREVVTPFFKGMRFKKQGVNYAKEINDISQCANIQSSRWNSNDGLKFVVNIGFFNKKIRKIVWDVEAAFPKVTDCFVYSRLGNFVYGTDHWYMINNVTNTFELKSKINTDLKYLIPAFDKYQKLQDFKKVFTNTIINHNLFRDGNEFVVLMEMGEIELATGLLREEYKRALIPKETLEEINYPERISDRTIAKRKPNQYHIDKVERLANYYGIIL